MIYSNRPKIKLELTPTDKLLEILGWGVLIVMWALVIFNYSTLPDTIPIHYNASGQVDGYGAKSMIWGILLIGSIMYVGMTYLNKYPHIFNFLTEITEENALRQYTTATKMLRYLKFIIVLMIGYLVFKTVRIATEEAFGLGSWLSPIFLGLLFGVMVYFIVLLIIKR